MRNPHLLSDGWKINGKDASGNKKFKRKGRDPKRVSEVKSFNNDSRTDEDSMGELMEESFRSSSLHGAALSLASSLGSSGSQNVAIDMRINAVPTITGTPPAAPPQPGAEPAHRDSFHPTFPQVTAYDHQSYGSEHTVQSRIVLCQPRSERSLSAASQAPFSNNTGEESPRRRPGESSGVVTEIKAIQQTRRLLANARERTRVHTISAAFEALRKQVPCYSYGQKLSKLAILRIACNYILSLAQLAQLDLSPEHGSISFRECVEQCTRTLQAEGRSKKRKE
ncbi:protein atonal homolog 8 [Hypomesus transpacificus]|uniref:protein atonal homolog 8 n=1 Tax=Hypomesus transpacificus TaxID=137520 RepID=UPI001F083620|nr:protein atonal homolog 8 [Hypomesus transpacificus]